MIPVRDASAYPIKDRRAWSGDFCKRKYAIFRIRRHADQYILTRVNADYRESDYLGHFFSRGGARQHAARLYEIIEFVEGSESTPILSHRTKGFAIVAKHPKFGFVSLTNQNTARGVRFEEIWIFGNPSTRDERNLWEVICPAMTGLPPEKVHYIQHVQSVDIIFSENSWTGPHTLEKEASHD